MIQLEMFPSRGNHSKRPSVPCRSCGLLGKWAAADCGVCRKAAREKNKTRALKSLHAQLGCVISR